MSSQQEEDRYIRRYFHDTDFGYYIDIGAGEPVKNSNTYELYKKGWKGLCIEPYAPYREGWGEERPNDILLPIAIMHYDGQARMAKTATIGSWVGNEYEKRFTDELYKVDCLNVKTLLTKYPEFRKAEFVSIDIESNEDNVLGSWDFSLCMPKVMCVERQLRGVDQRDRWEKFLLPHYVMDKVTYTNAFYVRR